MKYLVALFFMFMSFVGTSVALAQTNGELIDLAKPVLDAVLGGNYMYAAALALVLGVALLRRFGGAKYPILASKKAAPFMVLAGSFGAALATSLSAGAGVSLVMAWGAIKVAVAAAGGYALLKPILARVPYLGALFSTRVRAKAAGRAAVKADPSDGPPVDFQDVD